MLAWTSHISTARDRWENLKRQTKCDSVHPVSESVSQPPDFMPLAGLFSFVDDFLNTAHRLLFDAVKTDDPHDLMNRVELPIKVRER